ncbi:acetolactate decarboxylase [Mucilaginibacter sp. FT3.2]|uniref:acetolactate decarboxylase n=1 Tax=Mucilaginibacter sp. FT3.2 TaxID=2723090 RepID=UPI0016089C22|nr:acetolactate decarboxylase [Mucilaginibacter sp. FT3.2]MBB6230035.1 acetolactate decarboxylase [Mucilaginibacter sp. FT3.2]
MLLNNTTIAQQKTKPADADDNLFSAGFASGFIGGLYDNWYPYKQLEKHGNFGIGAPGSLDGELLMLDGKIYQTQATGKTTLIADTGKLPYAVVCFFKAKKTYKHTGTLTKIALFTYLDSLLTNQNGIYAIHITGKFKSVKTRAFPPVEKPYLPLAAMLNRQHFFEHTDLQGDLVGFRIPTFMEGAHISGYHFHFLSADKTAGGHLIDLSAEDITIEIDTLTSYTMDLPQTKDFNNFDFKKDRKEEIKSVENGKKM